MARAYVRKSESRIMASEHLVDPELKPTLDSFPLLDLSVETLPTLREMMEQMRAAAAAAGPAAMAASPEFSVSFEAISISGPGRSPPLRILCYRPIAAKGPLPAVLHIHGGGYILGSADMMDAANRALAAELNCAVFSVDYRLAPETAHPGPVEDCYAALKWLNGNAAALQVDATRIGVKGESAGGGLAAAVALLARDRGEMRLAFQHLIYPMIDDRTGASPDPHRFVGKYVWTPTHNRFGWSCLLGTAPGGAGVSPYAAAARAQDLTGLPRTFISVGALDLFLEEDLDYARRLTRAGVAVELHLYPGAFHGFDMAPQTARVAKAAARDSNEALRRALHD
jgi:acetyl esterase/lipase